MFKKITSALLALALVCSFALPAMADPFSGYGNVTSAQDLAKALANDDGEGPYEGVEYVPDNTVIVSGDVNPKETIKLAGSANITLVVNGSITGPGDAGRIFEVESGVTLTIQGSGTIKAGFDASGNTAAIEVEGTLNVEGGNISAADTAIYAAGKGKVNVSGGTVTSTGDNAIATNGSGSESDAEIKISGGTVTGGDNSAGVYLPKGTLTVQEGADISGGAGVVARGGTVKVEGGNITAKASGDISNVGDGEQPVPPAGIVVDGDYGNVDLTVEGGNISGQEALNVTDSTTKTVNPTISGGNFNGKITDESGSSVLDDKIEGGTFTNPGEKFDNYVDKDNVQAEAKVGDTYTVGDTAAVQEAVKNAQPGQTVTVENAPNGTDFQVGPGVVVENKMGSDSIKVNGSEVGHGESITIPMPAAPAGSAPAETPKPGEFIVCEACGHHNWEPYLEGWRCTNCGHLRGTTGVPAAAAKSASTAPKSPQTGLWWLLG